jgi:hypothetical protein
MFLAVVATNSVVCCSDPNKGNHLGRGGPSIAGCWEFRDEPWLLVASGRFSEQRLRARADRYSWVPRRRYFRNGHLSGLSLFEFYSRLTRLAFASFPRFLCIGISS